MNSATRALIASSSHARWSTLCASISQTGMPAPSSARVMNGAPRRASPTRWTTPSMRLCRASFRYHSARPRRHVDLVAERREPRRQRPHRVVAVAQVRVGRDGEVHRPDEDRAVALLEVLVEAHVEPEPAADPHQPDAFARPLAGGGRAATSSCSVRAASTAYGVPRCHCGQHHRRDRVGDRDRRRRGARRSGRASAGSTPPARSRAASSRRAAARRSGARSSARSARSARAAPRP